MIHYAAAKKVQNMTQTAARPHWQSEPGQGNSIEATLLPWLMYRGSLTNHLTKQSGQQCQVRVVKQAWELPHADEAAFLGLMPEEKVFVREVVLYGEKPWVCARSIFPKAVMDEHEAFSKIENRSLGEFLFKNKSIARGIMEFAAINKAHYLFAQAKVNSEEVRENFWARRSQFHVGENKIIVCEIFLPSVLELGFG